MSNQTSPSQPAACDALLLIGHGTRHATGVHEFQLVAAEVARRVRGLPVEACFLELAEPSIEVGIDRLMQRGSISRIRALPLVLFAAGHAKEDIPRGLAAAAARYPGQHIEQASHLGCHPKLVELSAKRFLDAQPVNRKFSAADTLLLMVGRGSRDADANSEMARFARLRWERTPVGWSEVCYTAMTQPALERGLEIAARLPFTRVVVQPHLLFCGLLAEQVRTQVDRCRTEYPQQEWILTDYLGPDPLLTDAICEIAGISA